MSQTSSRIESRLAELAQAVETETAGLRVIAARVASLPYVDLRATLEIQEARQFNVLEDFILRAAHELHPTPTLEALAGMLGLDPLFVRASWERLAEMKAVMMAPDGTAQLTKRGREYYLKGQLPPASTEEPIDVRYWVVWDQLVVQKPSTTPDTAAAAFPGSVTHSDAEKQAAAERALTDLPRLAAATQEAGLGFHQPDEGHTISAVSTWRVDHMGAAECALLVVQETLATGEDADTISVQVVDPASGLRFFDAEVLLRRWMAEGRVTLGDLLGDEVP